MVEKNGEQFSSIARGRADVTVTDRTEAMYRTAAAHQEDGVATHALCAGTELIGPVSRKALLLPAAANPTASGGYTSAGRAAATRDDGAWVLEVNRFLDAAIATGDYGRWQEIAMSSPNPRGRDTDSTELNERPAIAARPTQSSRARTSRSSPAFALSVALGVVVVGLLLALRSPGGTEVIFCCCAKRARHGGSYAGIPTAEHTAHPD
jgi:hypothetical protein